MILMIFQIFKLKENGAIIPIKQNILKLYWTPQPLEMEILGRNLHSKLI